MFLTHKDYKETGNPKRVIPDVKDKIKKFVGTGQKSYEEIVIAVQSRFPIMTNDEVITQIKEIAKEEEFQPKGE